MKASWIGVKRTSSKGSVVHKPQDKDVTTRAEKHFLKRPSFQFLHSTARFLESWLYREEQSRFIFRCNEGVSNLSVAFHEGSCLWQVYFKAVAAITTCPLKPQQCYLSDNIGNDCGACLYWSQSTIIHGFFFLFLFFFTAVAQKQSTLTVNQARTAKSLPLFLWMLRKPDWDICWVQNRLVPPSEDHSFFFLEGAAVNHKWRWYVIITSRCQIPERPHLFLPIYHWHCIIKTTNVVESHPVQNMKQMRGAVCGGGRSARGVGSRRTPRGLIWTI